MVERSEAVGGIVVTASHNPEEWNGLKFIDSNGCFIDSEKNSILLSNVDNNNLPLKSSTLGTVHNQHAKIDKFINDLFALNFINVDRIKEKKFKIVVDAINGANYYLLPHILEQLNCDVIKLFCDNSGNFERNPEPLSENLKTLSEKVLEYNADIGLACDPDGDRLAIVDEKGKAIGEENTLVLCADDYFIETKSTQPIVTNLSSTMNLDFIAKKNNIKIFRSPVGEANVVELMQEKGALIGGEGNGGVILKDLHLGRDSLVATIMLLNKLSKTTKSLSTIVNDFPQSYIIKDKISTPNVNLELLYESLIQTYPNIKHDIQDGVKLIWNDKWIHVRSSNTEPVIRIIAEANNLEIANSLIKNTKNKITSFLIEN